jgi:hypothetical protein
MDTDLLSHMYAEIVAGTPKDQSRYVVDDESSEMWDKVSEDVARLSAAGIGLEMVNEIPGETPPIAPVTASAVDRARLAARNRTKPV